MRQRIAYVCGPYRGTEPNIGQGTEDNIQRAWRVAAELWKRPDIGFVVCPHTNSAHMDEGEGAAPTEKFIEGDVAFIRERMGPEDVLVLLPHWEKSRGSLREYHAALNAGCGVVSWEYLHSSTWTTPSVIEDVQSTPQKV